MLTLSAKNRQTEGKKVKTLRKKGVLPAVLYGPNIKNQSLEVSFKEFEKVYQQAGESTLISLETENKKTYLVLIHAIARDVLTGQPLHIDFYQPSLEQEIAVKIPLILEGEAPAVKNLSGTLVKNISEIEVKALPQNLPKEILVDVRGLASFENNILIKDLKLPQGVTISRSPEEIVVHVVPPEKVEEELQKPIEEKVAEVKIVEKEKKPAAAEAVADKEESKEAPQEKKNEK